MAEEEWAFTVRVPSHVDKRGYVRFSKQQPRGEDDEELPTQSNEPDGEAEADALLPSSNKSNSGPMAWMFRSPYWSLGSTELLSVTFCAAWQNLPAFTKQSVCCASACCCCCCCSGGEDRIDYVCQTFRTNDIVKIEHYIDDSPVMGGERAIVQEKRLRLYLQPLQYEAVQHVVPRYMQDEWDTYCQNARSIHHDPNETSDDCSVILEFSFASHATDPPVLSKVYLPGKEGFPLSIKTITVLNGTLERNEDISAAVPATHIYINGYQSWSFTGSIAKGYPQPKSGLPNVFSRAFNRGGTPPPSASLIVADDDTFETAVPSFASHYTSDFFTCITSDGRVFRRSRLLSTQTSKFPFQELDETGGPALLMGWLSQRHQFGVVQADQDLQRFQMHCSVDGQLLMVGAKHQIETDWSYIQLVHPHSYDEEPMAAYLQYVGVNNQARPLMNGTLLTGWCSWYVFYENINAGMLRENFGRLASMRTKVPTNVAVVDDGYMTAWGDWNSLKPNAFPGGMKLVARDIAAQSMRPGVWLAPFAADKHSQIAKLHPDWIIRNDSGQPSNSSHCGKFFYGLDATNPAVRQHVKTTVDRAVRDWGFDVLKIDFLYAACLEGNGKYDPTMSRAEAMDLALKTIREAAGPHVFLIGCGCPIASAIGYIDAMRISADTGPTWYPAFPLPKWDNSTLPALRAMIRNSISRAPFGHRWWHNDPDCIMLGKHTRLTDIEVASAATVVAMTCGMLLLSDDLPKVSDERLSIVSRIFPLTGITATVLDLHSSNDGLPSLMRLWCTDKYGLHGAADEPIADESDHNATATYYGRQSSLMSIASADEETIERKRNCIHVTKGLGTWTILSVSNWTDSDAIIRVPPPALKPPPSVGWGTEDDGCPDDDRSCGFHVLGFWQSRYQWLPDCEEGAEDDHMITRKLQTHESEILHIKKVTPEHPQYIGSNIHFSCGYEVLSFKATDHSVSILLQSNYHRHGEVFVYVPRVNVEDVVQVTVNCQRSPWSIAGSVPSGPTNRVVGRVLKVPISILSPTDGEIEIHY